jgi:hypothetical protein
VKNNIKVYEAKIYNVFFFGTIIIFILFLKIFFI